MPFSKIPPGGTVIVTGGMLSGCTVVMAANQQGFYAYHAGTSTPDPHWRTNTDGAASIVTAHNAMRPDQPVPVRPVAGGNDLVAVGQQYPFSVIVYSDRSEILEPGTPGNSANQSTAFNYFERDPGKATVGTAEAVITKDMNGNVVVHVWVEKGTLSDSISSGDGIKARYKMDSGQSSTYSVPDARGA
ncbi:cytotoxic necrotizing factor Rho-activating domain-containing protein [Paraburkholderia phymatum]|uniref:Cytotoxic necrotizing factor Rho-activating domain-containing protein n=1 Tax=Paraburkholderia phymatum TaxID=148447 RepID=A0ACC6U058_9BURK